MNVQDANHWLQRIAGACPGDADLERQVTFADFVRLSDNYVQPGEWADGDFNGTGGVTRPAPKPPPILGVERKTKNRYPLLAY